jgi:hypothetical protein
MVTRNPRRGEATATAADSIVVEIPARLKHLVAPIESLIDAVGQRAAQLARDGKAVDYAAVERLYAELSGAIETAAHQCTLEAAAANEPQRIEIGGAVWTRVGEGLGNYKTMTGSAPVRRGLFRELGVRNGKTVDLISLRVGAIGDGWLPQTARAMAHHLQSSTSREAEQSARQDCRLPYSRASFERVPHLVGELWLEHHANIEDALIQAFEVPAEAASISVAIDRASVPMEEDVPRPPGRPRKNAPKRSVRRVFHMCYCATVTLHDRDGRALHTLRRGQMPGRDPQDLCNLLANDVLVLREKRPDLLLTLLADGAPEMWNLLESNFPVSVFGRLHRCVDFWHVVEKLSAAAKAIAGDDAAARAMSWGWRHQLRRRKDAAESIRDELLASGRAEVVIDGDRPVHDAITYLSNNAHRMNYAGAITKGLPIGSGNVEATCKTLVGLRMKRCGSRWHRDTGNHVLHLRALAISDRWDDAMDELFAKLRTSVRRCAA